MTFLLCGLVAQAKRAPKSDVSSISPAAIFSGSERARALSLLLFNRPHQFIARDDLYRDTHLPALGNLDGSSVAFERLQPVRPLQDRPRIQAVGGEDPITAGRQRSKLNPAGPHGGPDALQSRAEAARVFGENQRRNLPVGS